MQDGGSTLDGPVLTFTVCDTTLFKIVWGKLHPDLVTRDNTNEVLPHSAPHVRYDFVTGFQLNAKPSVGQCFGNHTINF